MSEIDHEAARKLVEDHSIPEPMSGCWLWLGRERGKGYGCISVKRTSVYAHRFSYEAFKGPIPAGLHIDHKCRNKSCVNPDHLEAVTLWENVRRGNGLSAHNARTTVCVRGHSLSGDNLRITKHGHRECLECKRMHSKRRSRQGGVVVWNPAEPRHDQR